MGKPESWFSTLKHFGIGLIAVILIVFIVEITLDSTQPWLVSLLKRNPLDYEVWIGVSNPTVTPYLLWTFNPKAGELELFWISSKEDKVDIQQIEFKTERVNFKNLSTLDEVSELSANTTRRLVNSFFTKRNKDFKTINDTVEEILQTTQPNSQ